MIPLQAVANHLWQSTLIAIALGLVALVLRDDRASARYWLWFAASAKFLIPFSMVVAVGSQFGPHAASRITAPAAAAMGTVSQPFAGSAPSARAATPAPHAAENPIPEILVAVWAGGLLCVLAYWWKRSCAIRSAIRQAQPLDLGEGRRALRSPAVLEPGVFGMVRQVLLLPEEIDKLLTREQLRSVLAHEDCHIRRRDNLTAAIHMGVEALFWFHPLVWWIGARLVEERERACDEEVLRQGNDPAVYAEAILRVCELYVESPLPCVAGITGSSLKRRVEDILENRGFGRLSFAKKALLGVVSSTAVVIPVVLGVMNAPLRAQTDWQAAAGGKMSFEVASVKSTTPESFTPPAFPLDAGNAFTPTGGRFAAAFPLAALIDFAYKITPTPGQRDAMLKGLPGWVATDIFAIDARGPATATKDQFRLMLQSLLAERFKLKVHFESRSASVYALMLVKPGKLGSKLRRHTEGPECPATAELPAGRPPSNADVFPPVCEMYGMTRSPEGMRVRWGSRNSTMASLAAMLPNVPFSGPDRTHGAVDRTVVDETGLTGTYDFLVEYAIQFGGAFGVEPDPSGPIFLDAMRDQLGLKLESAKGEAQVLVIDHLEQLSQN